MTLHPKLTVGIITHNDEQYLSRCLETLTIQERLGYLGKDWQIVVCDNASDDTTYLTEAKQQFSNVEWILSAENSGFGKGHNDIMNKYPAEFHAVLNNDILFSPNFLAEALNKLEQNESCGSSIGKLLWWNFGDNPEKTDIIDSAGIGTTKGHRFFDIGQGKRDEGQFDEQKKVFGGSGAAVIYRRSALEAVSYENCKINLMHSRVGRSALFFKKITYKAGFPTCEKETLKLHNNKNHNEYFDETMFMYKEDCDLAERLIAIGKPCLYISEAIAWHDRTANTLVKRTKRSECERFMSTAHQTWIIRKHWNWIPWNIKLQTLLREVIIWTFLLIREPRIFYKAHALLQKKKPEALIRRRQTKHTVSFKKVAHFFS